MDRSISQHLQVLFRAWFDLAEERPDVRDALLELRAWLNERFAGASEADRPLEVREGAAVFEKVLAPGLDRRVFNVRPGGGDSAEGAPSVGDRRPRDRRPPDLPLIAKRARWKADAVRWAVERRRMEAEGADYPTQIRPHDEELRARRDELEDCFAWMLDPYRRFPEDERMFQIADCYENVSLAAESTLALIAAGALEPAPPPDLLYQLAEAQSALLAALEAVDLRSDSDQRDLFVWLKNQTLRHRIYVDRHMKLDDPADFTASHERAERLRTLSATLMDRKQAMRRRVHLLNKVRFHLRKLADSEGAFGNDLDSIGQAVQEWKDIGYPLRDRHLVDMLESLPGAVPEGTPLPPLVTEVLAQREQEADESYAEANEADGPRRESAIERAGELVRGMRALLFGGPDDPAAGGELERALGLAHVRWVDLEAEPHLEALEAAIGAPDVDLVLLAVRLPEAAYADFKRLCRDRGAPFVRLPGGAAPHEVAQQLLRQVGRMLHGRTTERAGV